MDRDLIAIARDIRDELRLIRKAIEAANANDPIAAMEAAIVQATDDGLFGIVDADSGIPPEERWRLG